MPVPKNIGLTELEPALDRLAASLKTYHPPEIAAWALIYLSNELGLGDVTVVGDPDDPDFTVEVMLEGAADARVAAARRS